ncbi:unnamed protein product [Didymodactylos carnosus]|uniref:Uncharacterized protein n=1 Tax=Didymodactylos carnosus TaxID=1234261 RepID=A0A814MPX8_9BILA|nr:unnamed protein product [Didymodactylos carnosus]CAF1478703.1 unnamed protein product [Didymodactylos carnosus]CAF3847725.1 unnamed protein product [Didymodactylos carnosus]CAF4269543.1 unnamed protein product [Didymodactylos carnosus]
MLIPNMSPPYALHTSNPVLLPVKPPFLVLSFPTIAATPFTSLPSDILKRLPTQLRDGNSLMALFTSFVTNLANNSTSLPVTTAQVINNLVPSSSTTQASKVLSSSASDHRTSEGSSFDLGTKVQQIRELVSVQLKVKITTMMLILLF